MFNERGYLACEVVSTLDGRTTLSSQLHDGSLFTITLQSHEVFFNSDATQAFVRVEKLGQAGDRCQIQLPSPSLNYGHHVLVNIIKVLRQIPS